MNNNKTLGYINPWKYQNDCWEINVVASEYGFGHIMYESAMNFLYPNWIIPNRNKSIQPKLINTYKKFIDRIDIETQIIHPDDPNYIEISSKDNLWFNRKYKLKDTLDINYLKVNHRFVKQKGINFFNEKYSWNSFNLC